MPDMEAALPPMAALIAKKLRGPEREELLKVFEPARGFQHVAIFPCDKKEEVIRRALVVSMAKLEADLAGLLSSVCRVTDGAPDRTTMDFDAVEHVAEFDEAIDAVRAALDAMGCAP